MARAIQGAAHTQGTQGCGQAQRERQVRRHIRFRPKLRDTVRINAAYLAAMSPGGVLPDDLKASHETLVAGLPKQRKRREVLEGVDIDAIHGTKRAGELEGSISTDVGAMLRDHPRVLVAMRFNSGAVQRQTATGDFVPMWFHRWIARPEKMRLTDYFGWLADFRPFAIECKRENWRGPTDDRELQQQAFIEFVKRAGGVGGFARSEAEALRIIESVHSGNSQG